MRVVPPPGMGPAGPADMFARMLARRAVLALSLTEDFVRDTFDPELVTDPSGDWTWEVTAESFYRFTVIGSFTTAAEDIGLKLAFTTSDGAEGILMGFIQADTQPARVSEIFARGSPPYTPLRETVVAFPADFISLGVTETGNVMMDVAFLCTVDGTVEFRLTSSSPVGEATLLVGSSFFVQEPSRP